MACAARVPQLNANDDEILVQRLLAEIGQDVTSGDLLAVLESDKAVVEVVSPTDGFVVGLRSASGDVARVGAILVWIGATPTDTVPDIERTEDGATALSTAGRATAKAVLLARRSGISLDAVAHAGDEDDRCRRYRSSRTAGWGRRPIDPPPN